MPRSREARVIERWQGAANDDSATDSRIDSPVRRLHPARHVDPKRVTERIDSELAMSLHRSFNDPDVVRLLLDCAGTFIRDQVEKALEEKLPRYLGTAERRPPKASAPEAQPQGDHYVSRAQAAEITGFSERSITRYIDSGQLKVCGPRRNRITRFELDRFMEIQSERRCAGEPDTEADLDAEVDRILEGK